MWCIVPPGGHTNEDRHDERELVIVADGAEYLTRIVHQVTNPVRWDLCLETMAAAGETLTLPEVTQTVILTRVAGRTPMPEGEDLASLAAHRCTLCIYLSITLLHEVQEALRAAGWAEDAPMLVVQKASWPGQEKIVRGTLADIKKKCQAEKIGSQAMIVASPTLGAADWESLVRSKLYDPAFTHRFRQATAAPTEPS